ncbi:MAG: bifunctional methylenetetrahydrofolate dehydrogenase/methenyltetrahydrofolate cyclohydrolase FolD [Oligoflexales bacterium]|nr:bifunctional methylenetetrahydrofolate dehydrogenase/methenyltetrahydrofolate cyclohydrolase FolD [Oligoflexales bacterium]
MAQLIDGKAIAADIRLDLKSKVEQHLASGARPPALSVVLVGDDPASGIYVNFKEKACKQIGMKTETHRLPKETSESELVSLIDQLNNDPEVDGILVQLPLPKQIDKLRIIGRISPIKDVDGLGAKNQGLLSLGLAGHRPCTPLGVMKLLETTGIDLSGKQAAVIGRSILVGSPMVRLLGHANATVTNIHSRTTNARALAREADIIVAAAGVPELVKKDWVKPEAVLIDVGIHRNEGGKLVGDLAFDEVEPIASHITPVPGGVGPMTIAMLLSNCIQAYEWRITGDHPYLVY